MQCLITLVNGMDVDEKMTPVCLMFSTPMFLQVPESEPDLSRLQRLNTILLKDGGTSKFVNLDIIVCVFCYELTKLNPLPSTGRTVVPQCHTCAP